MLPYSLCLLAVGFLGLFPVWGQGEVKDDNTIDRLLRESGYEFAEVEKAPVRRVGWSDAERKVLARGLELMLERGGDPGGYEDDPMVQLAEIYARCVDRLEEDGEDEAFLDSLLVAASGYGLYDAAELLLRKGADPNGCFATFWGSPDHCMAGDSLVPLSVARDRKMAMLLLAAGADVGGEQTRGPGERSVFQWRLPSPLRVAVAMGNEELAVLLLDHGAVVLFEGMVADTTGDGRKTPLFVLACQTCSLSTVKRLLEAGAEDECGEGYDDALAHAIWGGKVETFEFLLSRQWTPKRLSAALREAAHFGRGEMVLLLLEKMAFSKQDVTEAFLELCLYDEPAALRALLNRGADVQARRKDGATALIWAACKGFSRCVALMLEYGADVRAVDRVGKDAWCWVQESGSDPLRMQPGHSKVRALLRRVGGAAGEFGLMVPSCSVEELAVMDGVLEQEERRCAAEMSVLRQLSAGLGWRNRVRNYMELLRSVRQGASPDVLGVHGNVLEGTLLWYACTFGDEELVRLLLVKGADPNRSQCPGGEIALEAAAWNQSASAYRRFPSPGGVGEREEPIEDDRAARSVRIVELLLQYGARGGNALHRAMAAQNVACMKLLLDAGADANAVSGWCGHSLLYEVVSERWNREVRVEMAVLLLAYGADVNWKDDQGRSCRDVAADGELREMLEKAGAGQGNPAE